MTLNFVLGTAAELIKIYPLIRLGHERGIPARVIMTGQSRENFLMQYRDFALPEVELVALLRSDGDLKRASSALRWMWRAARASVKDKLLLSGRQDFVLVHGDTLSTLIGAWLGRRARLPVVHIEAGLRSSSLFHPFPEEINRRLVSRLARWHMCPGSDALSNLRSARGVAVDTGGNTLLDSVRLSGERALTTASPFALVNVHRFENLNSASRWRKIVDTVVRAARDRRVVFVAHPQTLHKLESDSLTRRAFAAAKIEVRPRMAFSAFIALLKAADYLISDGGSNQEECFYLGKPCLLMRETSERREGLDENNVLSRFDEATIESFLKNPNQHRRAPRLDLHSPSALILDRLAEGRAIESGRASSDNET